MYFSKIREPTFQGQPSESSRRRLQIGGNETRNVPVHAEGDIIIGSVFGGMLIIFGLTVVGFFLNRWLEGLIRRICGGIKREIREWFSCCRAKEWTPPV